MAVDFKFPDVGEGIEEGTVVKWRVKEGDQVRQDQILVEMETDKAVVEIPAPQAGVIQKLHYKEGQTVNVGAVLVTIGSQGSPAPPAAQQPAPMPPAAAATPAAVPEEKYTGSVVGFVEESSEVLPLPTPPTATPSQPPVQALPAVRQRAKEAGVDLAAITGSGPGGRITLQDVERAATSAAASSPVVAESTETRRREALPDGRRGAASSPAVAEATETAAAQPETLPPAEASAPSAPEPGFKKVRKYDMWGYVDHVPFKGIRKATAQHMVTSFFTATHVTHMDVADITDLAGIRAKEKEKLDKQGIKLTFLPFILKAVVHALRDHPYLAASLDEENQDIILKKYMNIGLAVDTPDGLLVPVVKGVDQKSIADLAKEISTLAQKAASRKLDVMDMKGGVFTITNVGPIGGTHATPIINYPEVAILAVGRAEDRPVVRNHEIVIRTILPLSLTFDHRVVDGAEAARAMNTIKEHLEDPDILLVDRD